MDISKMSTEELMVMAYKLGRDFNALKSDLNTVNQLIAQKEAEEKKPTKEKKG